MSNRIIEWNLIQASEALKTLEDIAYFELGSSLIHEKLRSIREVLVCHQTENFILESTPLESSKTELMAPLSIHEIARRNLKEVAASLRTISEIAKLQARPDLAFFVDESRQKLYEVEKQIFSQISNGDLKKKLEETQIYLISGRAENEPFESVIYKVKLALAGGVQAVQLREKGLEASQICYLASQMKELCQKAGALFFVNDRPDIAVAVDADGVHIGQGDIDIAVVRSIVGSRKLIGISVHTQEEALAAIEAGVDYISIGPVFPPVTKPGRPPVGLDLVSWASQNVVAKPWFAVGGIAADNISEAVAAGAKRFAFVKYFSEASDQTQATNSIKAAVPPLDKAYEVASV